MPEFWSVRGNGLVGCGGGCWRARAGGAIPVAGILVGGVRWVRGRWRSGGSRVFRRIRRLLAWEAGPALRSARGGGLAAGGCGRHGWELVWGVGTGAERARRPVAGILAVGVRWVRGRWRCGGCFRILGAGSAFVAWAVGPVFILVGRLSGRGWRRGMSLGVGLPGDAGVGEGMGGRKRAFTGFPKRFVWCGGWMRARAGGGLAAGDVGGGGWEIGFGGWGWSGGGLGLPVAGTLVGGGPLEVRVVVERWVFPGSPGRIRPWLARVSSRCFSVAAGFWVGGWRAAAGDAGGGGWEIGFGGSSGCPGMRGW